MPRKLPNTPRSRVRSALRMLWMRSRERAAALKRERNTCQRCGVKASKAKGREVDVVVHHLEMVDWDEIIDLVMSRLLCHPDKLEVLCPACHDKEHEHDISNFLEKAKKSRSLSRSLE